jgi:catechol 2,3-dioxygenase-like lactoylglutathione lyase family enzyme
LSNEARARLVPELKVTDIQRSLRFWRDVLRFTVRYDRPEDGFAFLDYHGAQIMLDQRGAGPAERRGLWETGRMQHPFGRGINFEIRTDELTAILDRLAAAGIAVYFGPEERWYRVGAHEVGVRQCLVQDPDGYLVRMQEAIGQREVARRPEREQQEP